MGLTRVSGDVIQGTINVGVVTATRIDGNVSGDINSTGVSTFSTLKVGTGVTISGGIVTATTFSGNLTGNVSGNVSGNVTGNATGLSGTPNITVGAITASSAVISGNVSVAGTITYEDTTNVDSIGVITARSGIIIGTGTSISSPSSNVLTLGTNNLERVRVSATGNLGIGTGNPSSRLHVSGGTVTVGDVLIGTTHIDIMKMWRTADIQGYKSTYSDGGSISYSWDNGTVRVDTSTGSHNWDIGKVRLPVGVYQIYLQYRPSPTQHGWNVYGTNSNAHIIRLQSDAGYGSYTTYTDVRAQLNKDVGYSYLFKSGTYEVSSETTYRIGMQTDPYTTGGYKYFIEAAYLIKLM